MKKKIFKRNKKNHFNKSKCMTKKEIDELFKWVNFYGNKWKRISLECFRGRVPPQRLRYLFYKEKKKRKEKMKQQKNICKQNYYQNILKDKIFFNDINYDKLNLTFYSFDTCLCDYFEFIEKNQNNSKIKFF